MRERLRSDRGVSIFMLAISLFLLIGASAIAVDIAGIWLDRSTDQKVTDAAAAVGIVEAYETGSRAACESALTYVAVNTPDLNSVDTTDCATEFSGTCDPDPTLPPRELEVPAGRYEITVVYPVHDGHDLMTSRIISRTAQPLIDDDGEPCERLGVKMTSTRDSLFASVLGFSSGTTTVHTVALRIVGDERSPLNLIVLDRTGCNTISVNGGGKIIAEPVIEYNDSGTPIGLVPGLMIADSDGSGCSGSNGVINVSGAGSVIRSDGPAGCGNGETPYTYGPSPGFSAQPGCGRIQVVAPGTPGCNLPACSVSGGANEPNPQPTPLGSPYTREPADHKYNCYADYDWSGGEPGGSGAVSWATDALTTGNQQNIKPCEEGTDAYIYNLIDFVGPTGLPNSTFKTWTGMGKSCNPSGPIPTINENVVVDCATLQLTSGNNVTINGNVVFNGNVTVNGSLTINPPPSQTTNWVFFRGGRLSKGGSGKIAFNDAMVYMAKGSEIKLTGGSGSLTWTAPSSGNFQDLALWTDSTKGQEWSGQAALDLKGIFFMPRATASYSGTGGQIQTDAQWLAWRLEVGGGAVLKIAPSEGSLPAFADRSTLIR